MEFKQKDELGLLRTYYLITKLELDNNEYIVYTDLIKDKKNNYRILIGQTHDGKVKRVEQKLEEQIIAYFKTIEGNYKEYIREML